MSRPASFAILSGVRSRVPIVLLLGLLFCLPFRAGAADFKVLWDPNAEAVFCLLDLDAWSSVNTYTMHPLRAACLRRFKSWKGRGAAKTLAGLRGLKGSGAARLAASMAPLPKPGWRNELKPEDFLFGGGNKGPRALDRLAAEIRGFYSGADFARFLESNRARYEEYRRQVVANLPAADPAQLLEDYFGFPGAAGYRLVFSPMLPPDKGSEPMIETKAGGVLYQFFGPFLDTSGPRATTFADEREIHYLTVHEFSHAFLPKAFAAHPGLFDSEVRLVEPVSHQLTPDVYDDWGEILEEYFAHALEHRFALNLGKKKLAEELTVYYQLKGFELLPIFSELLAEYERSRSRYQDFSSFLPRVARRLAAVKVVRRLRPKPLGVRWRFFGGDAIAGRVSPGGAFAAAGGRGGDVVLKVGGRKIGGPKDLLEAVKAYRGMRWGGELRMAVRRQGEEVELFVPVETESRAVYSP